MKYIFCTFILIGAMTILFTTGASDLELIEFKDIAFRGLIGLGLVVIGFRGLEVSSRADRR